MHRDRFMVRRAIAGVIATLALASVPAADALADVVAYDLNQSNADAVLPDGVDYLRVVITSTVAGTASFDVTPVFAFTQGSNFGLQSFGFNYAGAASFGAANFQGLAAGWTVEPPPPSAIDGFGKFDFIVGTNGSGRVSPLDFTVTGLDGATPAETLSYFAKVSSGNAGQGNQYFAAHLSGFVAGAVTSADFGGSTVSPVPEPKAYALMLAGMGLIGFMVRRSGSRAA